MKIIILVILGTACIIFLVCADYGISGHGQIIYTQEDLAVPLYGQQTHTWCWAATGQMIMEYHGTSVSQCAQANDQLNRTDCCDLATCPVANLFHDCIATGWPRFALYGFTFKHTPGRTPLSWHDITEQIEAENRLPFAFQWHYDGGGSHWMVAKGIAYGHDENFLIVNDPLPVCRGDVYFITYDDYAGISGSHDHVVSFYNISGGN